MTTELRSAAQLLRHPRLEPTNRFEAERSARVDELRQLVLDGTYAVASEDVAEAIMLSARTASAS